MVKVLDNLLTENIGDEIKKACKFIYPLVNVQLRKVKTVKKPKFDVAKLNELYKDAPAGGEKAKAGGEEEDSKNLLSRWSFEIHIYCETFSLKIHSVIVYWFKVKIV